jgi:hypothetical protein
MKMLKKEIAKILAKGGFRFKRPVLRTTWYWTALRSAIRLLPGEPVERIVNHLLPKGNPGAGIFRGRHNISKAMTYRATYVGFNVARDARRASRKIWLAEQEEANAKYVAVLLAL